MSVWFKPTNNNTGSSTINLCTLGAKTIQKLSSGTLTNLSSGDLGSDSYSLMTYNGTVFVKVPLEGSGGSTSTVLFLPFGSTTFNNVNYTDSGWAGQGATGLTYPTAPNQNAPVAAKFDNTSAATSKVYNWIHVPSTYTGGAVQVKMDAYPNGVSGAVGQVAQMFIETDCIAVGSDTRTPSFGTAQAIPITITTSNGRGTLQTGSLASLTMDSCAANGMLAISIYRDSGHAGDNYVDDLYVFSLSLIF
jgi:hypothetical protein